MGTGDADNGGGMDRTEASQVAKCSDRYRIDTSVKARVMRIRIFKKGSQEELAWMLLSSEDAYKFASDILRNYDTLEGLD